MESAVLFCHRHTRGGRGRSASTRSGETQLRCPSPDVRGRVLSQPIQFDQRQVLRGECSNQQVVCLLAKGYRPDLFSACRREPEGRDGGLCCLLCRQPVAAGCRPPGSPPDKQPTIIGGLLWPFHGATGGRHSHPLPLSANRQACGSGSRGRPKVRRQSQPVSHGQPSIL